MFPLARLIALAPTGAPGACVGVLNMGKRRKSREMALQTLFQLECDPRDPLQAFDVLRECLRWPAGRAEFARMLVLGVCRRKSELDLLIRKASKHWRLERMAIVDRSILRLAVFELRYVADVPPKVAIDEAVELAKRFGTRESGAFINGVLDQIYTQLREEGGLRASGTGEAG